jgi:hypothetical protein
MGKDRNQKVRERMLKKAGQAKDDNVVALKKPNVFTTKVKAGFNATKNGIVLAATKVGSGFKTGATVTKDFVLNLTNKAQRLIERVAQGEKLAEECEVLAAVCREAADRSDLLEAAKALRAQADKLEAIAKG